MGGRGSYYRRREDVMIAAALKMEEGARFQGTQVAEEGEEIDSPRRVLRTRPADTLTLAQRN